MCKRQLAATVALFCLAATARAHEFTSGALTIEHPMAYETAPSAMTGGGYLTIVNAGTDDDRLIEVRADFPKVEVHTTVEEDGVARMTHVDAVEVPAGGAVSFEPGGYHFMFMGLAGDPFEAGEKIPATLVFEKAGEVVIVFNVEARPGADEAGAGHEGMEPAGEGAMEHGMSH